jgi:hypothetical protein
VAKLNPRKVRFGLRDLDLVLAWHIYDILGSNLDEFWGVFLVFTMVQVWVLLVHPTPPPPKQNFTPSGSVSSLNNI